MQTIRCTSTRRVPRCPNAPHGGVMVSLGTFPYWLPFASMSSFLLASAALICEVLRGRCMGGSPGFPRCSFSSMWTLRLPSPPCSSAGCIVRLYPLRRPIRVPRFSFDPFSFPYRCVLPFCLSLKRALRADYQLRSAPLPNRDKEAAPGR